MILEPPARMRHLPKDERGYVFPWFVDRNAHGDLDHRIMGGEKLAQAIRHGFCWVCGRPRGSARATFVIGPMCLVSRTTAEPGSHHDCAEYSVRACPFLTRPKQRRRPFREGEAEDPKQAGMPITRNPGVSLLYTTRSWKVEEVRADPKKNVGAGVLFRLGVPEQLEWYCEGRIATRDEVERSIDGGLPILRRVAEDDGQSAVADLEHHVAIARRYVSAIPNSNRGDTNGENQHGTCDRAGAQADGSRSAPHPEGDP